jgi:hypothetical protein
MLLWSHILDPHHGLISAYDLEILELISSTSLWIVDKALSSGINFVVAVISFFVTILKVFKKTIYPSIGVRWLSTILWILYGFLTATANLIGIIRESTCLFKFPYVHSLLYIVSEWTLNFVVCSLLRLKLLVIWYGCTTFHPYTSGYRGDANVVAVTLINDECNVYRRGGHTRGCCWCMRTYAYFHNIDVHDVGPGCSNSFSAARTACLVVTIYCFLLP